MGRRSHNAQERTTCEISRFTSRESRVATTPSPTVRTVPVRRRRPTGAQQAHSHRQFTSHRYATHARSSPALRPSNPPAPAPHHRRTTELPSQIADSMPARSAGTQAARLILVRSGTTLPRTSHHARRPNPFPPNCRFTAALWSLPTPDHAPRAGRAVPSNRAGSLRWPRRAHPTTTATTTASATAATPYTLARQRPMLLTTMHGYNPLVPQAPRVSPRPRY